VSVLLRCCSRTIWSLRSGVGCLAVCKQRNEEPQEGQQGAVVKGSHSCQQNCLLSHNWRVLSILIIGGFADGHTAEGTGRVHQPT
jgi:hypothetical protein